MLLRRICACRYVVKLRLPEHICQGVCVILPLMATTENVSLHLLFRALADPIRLRLLNLIADREICVCYLVEILKLNQPKISRHLAYLRRAGIVRARRDGKWMHYRLAIPRDKVAAGILEETIKHLRQKPEMNADVSRLGAACCSPQEFEGLERAPQPIVIGNPPSAR